MLSSNASILVEGEVNLGDIIAQIARTQDYDTVFEFILALDDHVQDADFTGRLMRHCWDAIYTEERVEALKDAPELMEFMTQVVEHLQGTKNES